MLCHQMAEVVQGYMVPVMRYPKPRRIAYEAHREAEVLAKNIGSLVFREFLLIYTVCQSMSS